MHFRSTTFWTCGNLDVGFTDNPVIATFYMSHYILICTSDYTNTVTYIHMWVYIFNMYIYTGVVVGEGVQDKKKPRIYVNIIYMLCFVFVT